MSCIIVNTFLFFFNRYCDHLVLHVLSHPCPTPRSADLAQGTAGIVYCSVWPQGKSGRVACQSESAGKSQQPAVASIGRSKTALLDCLRACERAASAIQIGRAHV